MNSKQLVSNNIHTIANALNTAFKTISLVEKSFEEDPGYCKEALAGTLQSYKEVSFEAIKNLRNELEKVGAL